MLYEVITRIWDEDRGLSTTYKWDAQSYSGFYYDLNSGVSSEEMTITNIKRNIDEGDIEYITRPTETDFEYNDWGVITSYSIHYTKLYDAKNAEVAFLHAVKAMGSAQTNFAGGQGFYNFLTFIAPYLEGKSEVEIKQLMRNNFV